MECNKDEAVKVKEIAEKKLLERDITGAKKFASKAQTMFPKLEGLSQFLEIIDVYASYEKKINGEVDYYGIFGVDPLANEEVLKKQYKRMALSLHPDKNKSVGADGAFKIMSQAWSVLSDKDKRHAYNLKLNIRASNQTSGSFPSSSAMHKATATNPQDVRPAQPRNGTCQQYTSTPTNPQRYTTCGTSSQHVPGHQHTPAAPTVTGSWYIPRPRRPLYPNSEVPVGSYFIPTPHLPKTTSSATTAHRPPLHPQRTPFTHQPTSTPRPSRPETFWTLCIRCRIQFEFHTIFLNQNLLCPECKQPFLATEMPAPNVKIRSSSVPLSAARTSRAAASVQTSSKHLKRRHEEAVNLASNNKSTVPEKVEGTSASKEAVSGINRDKPFKRTRVSGQKHADGKSSSGFKKKFGSPCVKDLSQIEIRDMLIGKAKREIRLRLNDLKTEKSKSSHIERVDRKDSQHAVKNDSVDHQRGDQSRDEKFSDTKNTLQPQTEHTDDMDANLDEIVTMRVPDANFHNFDDDRIEASFTENQVWAAYDDDDGMPRYYALVQRVEARNPFKIQISWLNSKSSSEFGSLDWIGLGFTKTNGEFRVGKSVISKRLNSFSHPVKWRKGARGAIQIFPTKGDVWALYRNWSQDWDEVTANEVIHMYDMVVVLEDYNEDIGVLVAPLVKVAGFTSLFNMSLGIRKIPKEEMFRFSHQVPFYMLNGLEAENVPKGCYELDPAALPLELLKVTTDVETSDKSSVEGSRYAFKYARRNKGRKM